MKQIKNEETKIQKDECLNDEDILNSYSVAINEMSNKYLYKKIMSIFEDTKDMARDIYNFMFTKGWYTITPEEDTKIEKSYTKYSNKMNELS